MITQTGTKKRHRDRKSPGSAEMYKKQRAERQARQPKQKWVGGESVAESGHWERVKSA